MKKIIEFFKSLFFKLEYVPTEYNVTVDEQPEVKQIRKLHVHPKALVQAPVKKTATKNTKTNNMIKEYGGKEKYPTKAAMKKHESKEGKKKEKSEKMVKKTTVKTAKKK